MYRTPTPHDDRLLYPSTHEQRRFGRTFTTADHILNSSYCASGYYVSDPLARLQACTAQLSSYMANKGYSSTVHGWLQVTYQVVCQSGASIHSHYF